MLTDTILEDDRWQEAGLPDIAERAARAVLVHLGHDPARFEIAVLGCDDARIAALNADFRGKPQPTNVLSWPAEDLSSETPGGNPLAPGDAELGDIAIAYDTCLREATSAGKSLADHACHLVVHGVMHLLGYDHVRDADATLMEGLEIAILGKLGLPDPYMLN
ncbi:rRNA maturation RNase YbeY [Thalassococcus sp. CAU 1522]|uniref:Endoribonuclease YbeY n=1 Tax=Thalassococcus arenae TaxID=2851652 RepID=A0ABS6N7R7_9RHOB|nr:rRNA maturation RNase YbeY [Thalassococcus arenae]MBV2360068.1 rRNA maturation RNase YbeY [Thalassococcus arenae]